jgi:hypothetical protein
MNFKSKSNEAHTDTERTVGTSNKISSDTFRDFPSLVFRYLSVTTNNNDPQTSEMNKAP